MPIAIMAALRAAVPWVATLLGGYVVKDWADRRETLATKPTTSQEISIVKELIKEKQKKYMALAAGAGVVGLLVYFIQKKF